MIFARSSEPRQERATVWRRVLTAAPVGWALFVTAAYHFEVVRFYGQRLLDRLQGMGP